MTRAAALLRAFMDDDGWSTSALARHVGLHKSVVHRLLVTLKGAGLLVQDSASGTFALGPLVAALGRRAERKGILPKLARPVLEQLAEKSRETVTLCVLQGEEGYCLDAVDSPHSMRFTISAGERFPVNAGCVGKILLAYQPPSFIEGLLERGGLARYTDSTITEPRALSRELAKIRCQGYGFSDSEITPGARSVGAPVFGADGAIVASLVISAPSVRMTDTVVPGFVEAVRSAATAISEKLGFVPPEGRARSETPDAA